MAATRNTWTNYGGGVDLRNELSDANSRNNAARGVVIAQKEVAPTVVDTAGAMLQDVKILIKEESDGNEASFSIKSVTPQTLLTTPTARNQISTTDSSGQIGTITTGLFLGHKFSTNLNMTKNVKTLMVLTSRLVVNLDTTTSLTMVVLTCQVQVLQSLPLQ